MVTHVAGLSLLCLQKQKLAAATLEHAVSSISFHPADLSCLIAVPTAASDSREPDSSQTAPGDGPAAVQLWRLDKLWSRHELHAIPLQLPADCSACSCHAWAPEVSVVLQQKIYALERHSLSPANSVLLVASRVLSCCVVCAVGGLLMPESRSAKPRSGSLSFVIAPNTLLRCSDTHVIDAVA